DRDVDEEDPVPADRVGEDAAGEQPHRAAGGGHEGVDPDRLRLLPWLGEHGDDHAEDHSGGHRPADSLDEAGPDEYLLTLCRPAQERRNREDPQADHEDGLAPEDVTE